MLAVALWVGPVSAQSFTVDVPADDGTPLATDVYLPLLGSSWPVVLVRTPYGKGGVRELCLALNLAGYACVAQDTRGRFDSGGEDTVFRDDGSDGRATLRWLAAQDWCDGKVGTWGGSALGITQYLMAPGAPGVLRCMVPVVATPDLYHHTMFQGGALRESLVVNWLEGQGSLGFLDQALAHRLFSPWWDPVVVLDRSDRVEVPALHMGGWYDIFGQGTLDAFEAWEAAGGDGARGRQYLVMGPWTHGGFGGRQAGELTYPSNAGLDLVGLMLDWYDRWLKDDGEALDGWPRVLVYLMGAVGEEGVPGNQWVGLDAWPPPHQVVPFHLAADGGLSRAPAAPGGVVVLADPEHPVPTLGGANLFPGLEVEGRPMGAGPYDQRPVEARDDVAVFSTAPLTRPLAVAGRVTVRVWIQADCPDVDVAVRLSDVYPDGRSMLVLDGIARARFRCGDDRECFLTPGAAAELQVDLWSTAIVFAPGHRIRISVSGSNAPRFEVNTNDGGDPADGGPGQVARLAILTGPEHPSALMLPVVPLPGTPLRPGARVLPSVPAGLRGAPAPPLPSPARPPHPARPAPPGAWSR